MTFHENEQLTRSWTMQNSSGETGQRSASKLQKLFRLARKAAHRVGYIAMNRLFALFCRVDEKKVLFLSDMRSELSGNFEFIYDQITNPELNKVLELKASKGVRRSLGGSLRVAHNIVTSKYIFLEDASPLIQYTKVRKGQKIVQLGHGTGALKAIGNTRKDLVDPKTKRKMKGHKNYTMTVVGTESERWVYAEAYQMPMEQVVAAGFARTDQFFDQERILSTAQKLKAQYPWMQGKKVILFAPTFRGRTSPQAYYDFEMLDLDALYEALHQDYVFVFKWHPHMQRRVQSGEQKLYDLSKYDGFFYDLSSAGEINDLLTVTDVLITDYSSVMFDYVFLNKPIVHYIYDVEKYAAERGLIYDFDAYVFGAVAKNCDELIEGIRKAPLCEDKRGAFMEKFVGACDGNSSLRTCQVVFEDVPFQK